MNSVSFPLGFSTYVEVDVSDYENVFPGDLLACLAVVVVIALALSCKVRASREGAK